MAQRRGRNKRRASESSVTSADAMRSKPSSMKSATSTPSKEKRRPPPLKSSFRKGLHSPKRVSPPVTFNQSVTYDDGSQADMSKSSMFTNLTPPPTPNTPKKNPLFFLPETSKTAALESKALGPTSSPEPTAEYEPYPPLPTRSSTESGLRVLEALSEKARPLTLEEASNALIALRDQVRDFSTKHFDYQLTCQEKREWPLADLQDRYPEFVANCAYIADGSQYGWRKLFTESYCRPQLVNGLLAHYLIEHVFKHTCFGLSEKELTHLENDVLKKYIHYDGFVRSRQLAHGISEILHNKSIEDRAFDTFTAIQTLATRILATIAPLLPSCSKARSAVSNSLSQILMHAQSLSLSLRLIGHNRTIVRFTFPAKHSEFQLGGDQNCLNSTRVDATAHHAPDIDRDELRVTIPCWPTIIATVPSGPDILDFKTDPSLLQRAGKPLPLSTGAPADNPGAFVTEVFMSPADVYCEWTPLAAPLYPPLKLTLWQAIAQAQKERAHALGQPWPPSRRRRRRLPHPWRRTAKYVLGTAAVGSLAGLAVTACTPHGRRALLETAKRVAHSAGKSDAGTAVTAATIKQILNEAATGALTKESFFSCLGQLPSRLSNLTSRITKPRTVIECTVVREMRRPNLQPSRAAGIYG